jgi:transposase-like protein
MPKTSPYPKTLRIRWYRLVDKCHRTVEEVCALYDIPKKTYYKWWKRDFLVSDGKQTVRLPDKKTKLTPALKDYIRAKKAKTNYGPEKMRLVILQDFNLKVSTTILYRFYKKAKLIRKPQKKYAWYSTMTERLIITGPGQGVQLDVKHVYEFGKRRCQFSVFDPYTELYHFTIFDSRHSINATTAYLKAEAYFGFKILSVQTDNGSEFRGDFHSWLIDHNLMHYFIPKKSPWWNGKVERVHKTIDEEYYHNPFRIWKTVHEWLQYYNEERIHLSINGLTPRQKLALSVTH